MFFREVPGSGSLGVQLRTLRLALGLKKWESEILAHPALRTNFDRPHLQLGDASYTSKRSFPVEVFNIEIMYIVDKLGGQFLAGF